MLNFTFGTEAEISVQQANSMYGANVILTRAAFLEILQAARNYQAIASSSVSAGYQPRPCTLPAVWKPTPPGAE